MRTAFYMIIITMFFVVCPILSDVPVHAVDNQLVHEWEASPEKEPLPRYETEAEKKLRRLGLFPREERDADSPPLYMPRSMAEFHPMEGVLIRWTGSEYTSTYQGLIDEAQEEGIVYISVESSSQQSYVISRLNNWGIPLDNIEFLILPSDSIWMRDYGPSWIYRPDGEREIIDFDYDRPRPNDDAFPSWLGSQWGMAAYETDLMYEGGNFIADGCGTCLASNRIYDQNAFQYSQSEVDQIMHDYFGCERLIVLTHMTNDGTGHIDMFCKLLDVDTAIMGEVSPGHQDYEILEANAAYLSSLTASNGNLYEVIRIPMGSSYRTYTNSLIMNDKVIVPNYYGGSELDAEANGIYESAMPGYEVAGVDCSSIISAGGAIHCITMGVPETCPAVSAPGNPSIAVPGDNELLIQWDAVVNADGYIVYRSEISCDEGMTILAETATNEYSDTDVSGGFTYYYRIAAFNYCMNSEQSACVWETATGDCVTPPQFDGIQFVNNTYNEICALEIGWNAATPVCGSQVRYNIYRSTNPVFSPGPENMIATCLDSTTYLDQDALYYEQAYYYVVRAEDDSGSGGGPCWGGNEDQNLIKISGYPTGPGTPGDFSEDVENGENGWTLDPAGLWHIAENSSCIPPGYSSPTHAWYYGQEGDCDYSTGSRTYGSLISPTISGITAQSALFFVYYREVEDTSGYDITKVEASGDNGASWNQVWYKDGGDPSPEVWVEAGPVSLSDFAGEDILLRFTFDSTDDYYNSYAGWGVDDIVVTDVEATEPCWPENVPTGTPADTPTMTFTPENTFTPTNTPTNTSTQIPTATPTLSPTLTVTHTPTSIPSLTPTRTPTITSTSTPTRSPTSTPTHTYMPTETPPPSPTLPVNSPTPPMMLGVKLILNADTFHPEMNFNLDAHISNPGPEIYEDQPFVALLNVLGAYFYYPSWSENFDFEYIDLSIETLKEDILFFRWPDTGNDAMDGIVFYGALLTKTFDGIVGTYDSVIFGYGP